MNKAYFKYSVGKRMYAYAKLVNGFIPSQAFHSIG